MDRRNVCILLYKIIFDNQDKTIFILHPPKAHTYTPPPPPILVTFAEYGIKVYERNYISHVYS